MDEYIRRSDALNACSPVIATGDDGVGTIGISYDDIKLLPKADVRENIRGEWVQESPQEITILGGTKLIFSAKHCSNCGEQPTDENWNFCPRCGADMRY